MFIIIIKIIVTSKFRSSAIITPLLVVKHLDNLVMNNIGDIHLILILYIFDLFIYLKRHTDM